MGINGPCVDDVKRTGDSEFQEECSTTRKRFETSGDEILPFTFARFNIQREPDESLLIYQSFYLKKLEQMDRQSSEFSYFCSMRIKQAWMSNKRPEIQFEISHFAQITQQHFDDSSKAFIKKLNDAVR